VKLNKSCWCTLVPGAIFLCAAAGAQDYERPVTYPTIPAVAQGAAGFVPKGWLLEIEKEGDLNKDGAPDLLLVLRMNDPNNVVKDEYRELDTNPRMLVAAFADKAKKTYSLALADHTLITRHTNPNMDPPFDEGAAIVNGTLQVSLGLFMNAGGWYTSNIKFTFRHQDGCFKLIGYDSRVLKRNTGEEQSVSINYLTNKALLGGDRGETWETLKKPGLLCLGEVGDGLDFAPEYMPFP
jgi:hypothetical protein